MKNLCFIGTSHLGILASAWYKRVRDRYPHLNPTFFTGPGTVLYEAEFLPKQIKAPHDSKLEEFFTLSAGGQTTIELDHYDCFIFQGLDHQFIALAEMCQAWQTDDEEEQVFFSSACLAANFEAMLERSPITKYIQHIRAWVETPIIVSMTPKTSILAIEKHPEQYAAYLKQVEAFEAFFLAARAHVLNYPNLSFVEQPAETLATPYFSKVEYLNPYGKQSLENITDYWHKNIGYGQAAMNKILQHVARLNELASNP